MPARTHPVVTRLEAARLIAEILDRRKRHDDPDLARSADDPLGAVRYVVDCTHVPAEVLRRDLVAALRILEYARVSVPATPSRLNALESRLLATARAAGLSYAALAEPLGLRSRQAVEQRIRRHEAGSEGLPRTERAARAFRRGEDSSSGWAARHGESLCRAARALLTHGASLDGEDAEETLRDLAETIEAVPVAADRRYAERIAMLAARLRQMVLPDVFVAESLPPSQAAEVEEVLNRLRQLTEDQRDSNG